MSDQAGQPAEAQSFASSYWKVKKPKKEAPLDLLTLDPLDPSLWNQLDGKAKWDSQVALRGPDYPFSTTAKHFTTAVIRWRMSAAIRVGGQVNDRLPFVVLPASFRCPSQTDFDWMHFLQHVYEAACWLHIPVAKIPADVWFKHVMDPAQATYAAEAAFAQHLTGAFKSTLEFKLKQSGYATYDSPPSTDPAPEEATSCPE